MPTKSVLATVSLICLVMSFALLSTACDAVVISTVMPTQAPAKVTPKLEVAVLLPGPTADGSWNMLAYSSVKQLQDEGEVNIAYMENLSQADISPTTQRYADEGYDLIVGHGFQFGSAFIDIAPEYPDVFFFVSSMAPAGETIPPNLQFIDLQWHYGGYLTGALAALLSESHIVGIVGGADNPIQRSIAQAFAQGADDTVPGTTALTAITGDYNNADKGRETALAMIDQGADVIAHWANVTGLGAIMAAVEMDKIAIGVYADQTPMAWDNLASSMTVDLAHVITTKAYEVRDGTFEGGVWAPPFNKIFRFQACGGQFNPNIVSDDIAAEMDGITQKLLNGEIQVHPALD